ncbi:MAG: DUF2029 domain-containing protein [Planctomycetes bacterium]|nr:DUF2029 domain-containing protein [Planctomycetota bacterium]
MRRPQLAFAAAWLLLVGTAAWLVATDRLRDLEVLGVPTMQPRFADVRPITGAAVALQQGLDPLQSNPGDPWQRALNYPRVWLLPAWLGLGPAHSEALALVFLALFAAGLWCLLPLAQTTGQTALLAALAFAPVTWLAIERANNDVVVFALLALAAACWRRRPGTGTGLVGAAAVLKLYPVFAAAALAGLPRARALRLAALLGLGFGVYVLAQAGDLGAIRANSLAWNRISYGITQLPDALAANTGWPRAPLLGGAAAVLAGAAALAFAARRRAALAAEPGPALDAFRIGAGVFVGTFCLGSNFDYRLLALLLTAPQVATWCSTARGWQRAAAALLAAGLLALFWSMTWRRALAAVLGSETPGLIADELVTWSVLLLLLGALVTSLPLRATEPTR